MQGGNALPHERPYCPHGRGGVGMTVAALKLLRETVMLFFGSARAARKDAANVAHERTNSATINERPKVFNVGLPFRVMGCKESRECFYAKPNRYILSPVLPFYIIPRLECFNQLLFVQERLF